MKDFVLELNNSFFDPSARLAFSSPNPYVVYGKNGSGKTTISRAFKQIQDQQFVEGLTAKLFDTNGNQIELSEAERKRIFVFNEDFVHLNVRAKSDGLKPIVIIGESAEVDAKIESYQQTISELNEKIKNLHLERFEEKKSPDNIEELKKSILSKLKEDGGYADRGRKIRAGANKISVPADFCDTLLSLKVPSGLTKAKIADDLSNLIVKLDVSRGKTEELVFPVPQLAELTDSEAESTLLFHEDAKLKGELKERFDRISSLYGTQMYASLREQPCKENYCPVCLRDFDQNSYADFQQLIDSVFDDRVDGVLKQLASFETQLIDVPLINGASPYYGALSQATVASFNEKANTYNQSLAAYRNLFDEKKGNPRALLKGTAPSLDAAKTSLLQEIASVQKEISDYNEAVRNYHQNERKAMELNQMLARFEMELPLRNLKKLLDTRNDEEKLRASYLREIEKNEKEVETLNSQKSNHAIAVEEINKNLAHIYASRKRLRLIANQKNSATYQVSSREKKVKPSALSTGERNSIGLCYFYETIKEEKLISEAFAEEAIVVIDDPVTSLDSEAKSGILEFIGKIVTEVTAANANSKVIVLTHDLEMLQYFCGKNGFKFEPVLLNAKKELVHLTPKRFSVYGIMLRELYDFGRADDLDGYDETIYNRTRRVLEGFSSFIYRGSYDLLFTPDIWKGVNKPIAQAFFTSTGPNQQLNSESHLQYWMKRFPDSVDMLFDAEAAQRIVRQAIVLLYELQPEHVIKNVCPQDGIDNNQLSKSEVERTIANWADDLFDSK